MQETKDLLIEFNLPQVSPDNAGNAGEQGDDNDAELCTVAEATMTYLNVLAGNMATGGATLTVRRVAQPLADARANPEVAVHRARIMTTNRMREAMQLADQGRHDRAGTVLQDWAAHIQDLIVHEESEAGTDIGGSGTATPAAAHAHGAGGLSSVLGSAPPAPARAAAAQAAGEQAANANRAEAPAGQPASDAVTEGNSAAAAAAADGNDPASGADAANAARAAPAAPADTSARGRRLQMYNALRSDIAECSREVAQPRTWATSGKKYTSAVTRSHAQQRSVGMGYSSMPAGPMASAPAFTAPPRDYNAAASAAGMASAPAPAPGQRSPKRGLLSGVANWRSARKRSSMPAHMQNNDGAASPAAAPLFAMPAGGAPVPPSFPMQAHAHGGSGLFGTAASVGATVDGNPSQLPGAVDRMHLAGQQSNMPAYMSAAPMGGATASEMRRNTINTYSTSRQRSMVAAASNSVPAHPVPSVPAHSAPPADPNVKPETQ